MLLQNDYIFQKVLRCRKPDFCQKTNYVLNYPYITFVDYLVTNNYVGFADI